MARDMKDSGIEWIGEIPREWNTVPIRAAFSEIKNKNIDGTITNALQFKYGNIIRKKNFNADNDDYVADTILNYNIVEPNTIMINCLNLNYDFVSLRVAIVKETGIITSAYLAVKPNEQIIYPMYANYLFKAYDNCKAFHNMGIGVRKTLSFDELKIVKMLLPPMKKQVEIVYEIDSKCSEIDAVINKVKETVEEYKKLKQSVITEAVTKGVRGDKPMKNSGVEWIGEIPEDWKVCKIKNRFIIFSGATPKTENLDYWDGEITWITPADYKTSDKFVQFGKRNISKLGYESCGTTIVPKNNLIFSKRAPIGSVAINKIPLCTNQGCLSCIKIDNTNETYYYYTMSAFTEIFELFGSGTTFKEISQDIFSAMLIPFPQLAEQQEIADYLDKKCAEIDAVITQKEQLVTELENYKKSLIYEYVTGKKEVI